MRTTNLSALSQRPGMMPHGLLRLESLEPRDVPAITIQLDYTYDQGFFAARPEARTVLERVASDLGNMLTANLAAITPSAGNTWTATFFNPSGAGEISLSNLSIGGNTLKVFVGGEVDKPGVYDMPGDINALQAVIQAGGFKTTAKRETVVIIRRSPDGRAMMRTVDLKQGIAAPGRTDLVPLRRFDIVYVPRTGLASAGVFMQQIKDLIPGNVGFDYALTNQAKIF